ncbi:MAG: protein-L-isoaspartate(D-aspartate) O-methyltransferase [Candidatus Omnitrophica bacterium]|nr:protein-L-isoaspartate(D-aspartate) O-methyltransferase [Candidatus Omnitrophota bacterium]
MKKLFFRLLIIFALQIPGVFYICAEADAEEAEFAAARENMVKTQIEARGIKDKRLLTALREVERHKFVPDEMKPFAYNDYPLPIGEGQTISQPYIVALMTELLKLKGSESVLEIGTGSGYQAAILAELCASVYSVEILESLALRSKTLLRELGYQNIEVKYGDGYLGWEEHAPFDAIIVTCAPPQIPQSLIEQLKDGGRMIIPVGEAFQKLELIEKDAEKTITKDIIPVRFVPMVHGKD